jgi:hypothetical protein
LNFREKDDGNHFQIDSASISDRGLSEKRPHNEDSFLELTSADYLRRGLASAARRAGDVGFAMAER